jgi:hypothetical protein
MSKIAFKVVQSNEKSTKPGEFITKINRKITVDTPFGVKEKSETYYIAGNKQVKEGTMIPENSIFPMMRVQEYPMINPDSGEEFMGKWLHVA